MRSQKKKIADKKYQAAKRKDPAWIEQRNAASAAHYAANRERCQFNTARNQAKKRGIEFALKFEDVIWPTHCPVFGVRLARGKGAPSDWSPSMDRIESNKGYVPGNVIVVSQRANRIKSNATVSELQRIVDFYSLVGEENVA